MDIIKKILDSQPTISFATFGNHKIASSNRKFNNFFEVSNEEISKRLIDARDIFSIITDKWIDDRLREHEKPFKISFYRDGKDYIFDVYLSITYIDDYCLYIYTMMDITELEMLKRREFNQAKMASIGELSLGLTHEVNTPLTYIKGNIELIEMDIEYIRDSELEECFYGNIQAIKDGVERINTIIELLKEYSSTKNENVGEIDLIQAVFDTFQLIYSRSKNISRIYLNGRELIFNNPPFEKELLRTKLAVNRLAQIFLILINNSLDEFALSDLKFEDRFIKIEIENYKNSAKISVKDNGGGIDEKIKSKIFEPFISGKSQCGMGLGLNIAKKIIEESGGKIYAENIENGAVFTIEI